MFNYIYISHIFSQNSIYERYSDELLRIRTQLASDSVLDANHVTSSPVTNSADGTLTRLIILRVASLNKLKEDQKMLDERAKQEAAGKNKYKHVLLKSTFQ